MKTEKPKPTSLEELMEYNYDENVMVEVPGTFLHEMIHFSRMVENANTFLGFVSEYGTSAKEVKEGGKVVHIEENLKYYPTPESYFFQKPKEVRNELGGYAKDMVMRLSTKHIQNIELGLTKKPGTFAPVEEQPITL